MYGYVRPLKGELRVRELEQYQAAYCGLCYDLGRRYGLAARFLVSYDLTFLYCLLTGCLAPQPLQKRRCPANPLTRKTCAGPDAAMDYAADVCVLLGWYKLQDACQDERGPRRLGARAARLCLRRAAKKAKAARPEEAALMQEKLAALSALEAAESSDLDSTADAFAGILQACADFFPEQEQKRPAEQILYHLGRFIYLCDAWDDLADDRRAGRYNPVARRFNQTQGELEPQAREALETTLQHSVRLAAAALELLPLRWGKGLLENIIYYGLPSVLNAVANGDFHPQKHARSGI